MSYVYLAIAIVAELIGTSLLKASEGFTKLLPTAGVILFFICAFFFMSLSLKTIPLNIAYAIWSGLGTVATVIISILIWKEKVTVGSIIGISLIVIGVVVLNMFGPGQSEASDNSEYQVNQP
ncbi:DMT family transporter [Bacillus sp. T33-2]|uniref:DMT family transporter n=1 Tax=Bacillus sp. T33-2 TaxID=2054168 RepID=UPI000C75B2B3|nr:multidrug efflux SMR transporter [Bacillus sp. T33-2]PLR91994.1 QacE family quaternary ammonium compound efflux SMR transporter [Bacillus sp. T33-2]